jgi:adenylate cyclase
MHDPGDEAAADGGVSLGPKLIRAVKIARELLPGDSRYGDPLSTVGSEPRAVLARRLGELAQDRPGLLKEMGLSALQLWEAAS